jgi:sulfite exporter TauE/SafE
VGNWVELFRSLGQSLLDVLRAEVEALQGDLTRTGRHLGLGAVLLGGAAVVAFWLVGALTFAVGAVLAIWLPVWAAAWIVVGLFLLLALALGIPGWLQLKKAENPAETFKRRLGDHLAWWQDSLLREDEAIPVTARAADPASPAGERRDG